MNGNGDSLPAGWARTTVGEAVGVVRDRLDPQSHPDLPFIGMENVEAHTMRVLGTVPASTMRSAAVHFLPGDVLYGRLRPYLNKVVAPEYEGLCSAEFIPLTPKAGVHARFLQFRLNSADFVSFASQLDEGDRPRVDFGQIGVFPIDLPPTPEQHRIVAAIESHFSRLDKAVALLERVQRNLARYRASVLKAAVEGRLVPTEAALARRRRVEAASRRFLLLSSLPPGGVDSLEAARCRFYDPDHGPRFFYRRDPTGFQTGNLPHWRQQDRTYFVTFRLADSLPQDVVQRLRTERENWLSANPEPHSARQKAEFRRFSRTFEETLDKGHGECVLRVPAVRDLVRDALLFFDGERYFLHDFVIMPNHVHVLLTVAPDEDLSRILGSLKSFTAKEINRRLGRAGLLWQKESFDHIVRDADGFERFREYIGRNAVGMKPEEFVLGVEREGWDEASRTRRDAASTFEPASVLLARIQEERRRKEEAASRRFPCRDPVPPDTTDLPELPEGWCWARIGSLGLVQLGRQRSPENHQGPHMRPYLRVANVFEDRIDTSDVLEMNFDPRDFETYRLEPGDILLNEGQSPHLVGRPAMYRGEVPGACFQNTLVRFKAHPGVDPAYALTVFRAQLHALRYKRFAKITTNIAHLGAERFADVEFPLPPLVEQRRIVAAVEDAMTVVGAAERDVNANLSRCARLRQSILRWAFEGRLADQNPSDEPAQVLLDRIRSQRTPKGSTVGPTNRRPRTQRNA
jgi:type I restriction enzyme S subunit